MKHVCKKCMSRYEGDFCPLCAQTEVVGDVRPERPALSDKEKRSQKTMLITLCVIGVVFIGFILYRNGVVGSRAYEKTVTTYFESICSCDFERYISVMTDEMAADIQNERAALEYSGDEYMRLLFDDYFASFGKDMSVTIDFGESSIVEDTFVNAFEDEYEQLYGVRNNGESYRRIDATVTFGGSVGSETIEYACFVMKKNGTWYMAGCEYAELD